MVRSKFSQTKLEMSVAKSFKAWKLLLMKKKKVLMYIYIDFYAEIWCINLQQTIDASSAYNVPVTTHYITSHSSILLFLWEKKIYKWFTLVIKNEQAKSLVLS